MPIRRQARLASVRPRPLRPGIERLARRPSSPASWSEPLGPEPGGRHPTLRFEDDAAPAGLAGFVLDNGASPSHQLPEMFCGGVGLIDYDGDGFLDVYLDPGRTLPARRRPSDERRPAVPEPRRRDVRGRVQPRAESAR